MSLRYRTCYIQQTIYIYICRGKRLLKNRYRKSLYENTEKLNVITNLDCGMPYLMPTPTLGRALMTFFTVAWSGNAKNMEAETWRTSYILRVIILVEVTADGQQRHRCGTGLRSPIHLTCGNNRFLLLEWSVSAQPWTAGGCQQNHY